jgi:hypothetical protein
MQERGGRGSRAGALLLIVRGECRSGVNPGACLLTVARGRSGRDLRPRSARRRSSPRRRGPRRRARRSLHRPRPRPRAAAARARPPATPSPRATATRRSASPSRTARSSRSRRCSGRTATRGRRRSPPARSQPSSRGPEQAERRRRHGEWREYTSLSHEASPQSAPDEFGFKSARLEGEHAHVRAPVARRITRRRRLARARGRPAPGGRRWQPHSPRR